MNRIDVLNMISRNEISVEEGLRLFETLEEEKIIKEKKSLKQALNKLDNKMKEVNQEFIKPNVRKGYKTIRKGFNKLDKKIGKLLGEES